MKNTGIEYLNTEKTPEVLPIFAELLPPLTEEQFSLLEADLLKNGCYTPIIVNENLTVIDGHNRFRICEKYGIPYRMAVFSFTDDLEAKQWALNTQKSRRNLSINELCKIALKLRPEVEARAKANMSAGGGDQKSEAAKSGLATLPNPISSVDTRKELAATVGVGERTMGKAMKIEDEAPQVVKDAVDNEDISIHQGYAITRQVTKLPAAEQELAAEQAVAQEIAKHDKRRNRIDNEARIAKQFCCAFEKSIQISFLRFWKITSALKTETILKIVEQVTEFQSRMRGTRRCWQDRCQNSWLGIQDEHGRRMVFHVPLKRPQWCVQYIVIRSCSDKKELQGYPSTDCIVVVGLELTHLCVGCQYGSMMQQDDIWMF